MIETSSWKRTGAPKPPKFLYNRKEFIRDTNMPLKKTALIVEDSPTQLLRLEYLLSENGLDAICARDGEEGLSKAQLYVPDVIVLDVELPGMNGLQVGKLLKADKRTHFIPIIFFTAIKAEIANFGSRIGWVAHIAKGEQADQTLLETLKAKGIIEEIRLAAA